MGTSVEDAKRDKVSDRLDALLLEQQETNRLLRRLLVPVELICRYFSGLQHAFTPGSITRSSYSIYKITQGGCITESHAWAMQYLLYGLFAPPARLYPLPDRATSCPNHPRTPGP